MIWFVFSNVFYIAVHSQQFPSFQGAKWHHIFWMSSNMFYPKAAQFNPMSANRTCWSNPHVVHLVQYVTQRVSFPIWSGWWFQTWILFSIMGCHPSHWLSYLSRWLLHHQPVMSEWIIMTLRDVTGMMIRLWGIIPTWRQFSALFRWMIYSISARHIIIMIA